jgi:hypothetical protein
MVRAGVGAGIFDKLEPHKNRPAPQHCTVLIKHTSTCTLQLTNPLFSTVTIFNVKKGLKDVR